MNLVDVIKTFLRDIRLYSKLVVRKELRRYQLAPARAIVDSVINGKGLTFAVIMSRQAGKNELSAQIEAYLMTLYQHVRGSSLVKGSPTYKPQTVNSKMRLVDTLSNPWNEDFLKGQEGYIIRLGRCRTFFFSAHRSSNVVGATANVLLECDEAQDVESDKWDKDFAPMAASTNATVVFYGTVWTSRTMLARVTRALRVQQARDGVRRVFEVPWTVAAAEVPSYGEYVRKEIRRLGRHHPIVRTQYCLEEIEGAGLLFGPERRAMMRGTHEREREPVPGVIYALTVDVAGEDEELEGEELRRSKPRKDSTAVTMFRVDMSTCEDPLIGFPRYEVVNRWWWTGRPHADLYAVLVDLAEAWRVAYMVVDATGVGGKLAEYLGGRLGSIKDDLPGLVVPFIFTGKSKSELAWEFLAVIGTGRYKDYVEDGEPDTQQFWRELECCTFEVMPGPGKRMRWGVDDPEIHDDFLISAALVAELDKVEWIEEVSTEVLTFPDVMDAIDAGEF